MFKPKYTITNRLLGNVTRIHTLATQMNYYRFPTVVLAEFEKTARAVSAHASTSIEGNPLPLTEVKKILKNHPAHARDSEKEILNYNSALEFLNQKHITSDVSLQLLLETQQMVTVGLLPKQESGNLRKTAVVVNDPRSGKIAYLPPDFKDVKTLLDSLFNFVTQNKSEIDPLILAGIFHKQLVLIHPFTDGNGRTTRLVTKMLLATVGLNTFNLFSFENYYNQNVTKYFASVGEYGDYYELGDSVDFTNWLEYFTDGIIDELLRVERLLPRITTPKTAITVNQQIILDIIKDKSFVRDRDYAARTSRARATRHKDFQKLIALGIIELKGQSRASYYVLKET